MVGKSMSWRYDSIPPCLLQSERKSSYLHLNSKEFNFHWWRHNVPSFYWSYLAYRWSIFSQILICCNWDNSLQDKWHFLHFDDVIIVKFSIKGDNAKFFIFACYVYGRSLFFLQTWICMAMIFEPYLGCYGSILSPDLVCCSWDYGLSIKWSSILNRMSGTCSNFQFILLKHITLICQHDKLPLVTFVLIPGLAERWFQSELFWHI